VIIARAEHPIARISGIKQPRGGRVLGRDAGLFELPDDFDAPLPEDVLNEFER
jgi:antitoxin (DNA-binding transcriptional repressor) of toxin-antitoxin stability system